MPYQNQDFDAKLRATQEKAGQAAEQGFSALTKSLQDVIALQTSEIERLRGIIESATEIPERIAAEITVASYSHNGTGKCDVVVKANDGGLWLLPNAPRSPYAVPHANSWVRLPALPQAADEMNAAPRRPAENEGE